MKITKIVSAVMVATTLGMSASVMTPAVSAQAKAKTAKKMSLKTIPKKFRGTWYYYNNFRNGKTLYKGYDSIKFSATKESDSKVQGNSQKPYKHSMTIHQLNLNKVPTLKYYGKNKKANMHKGNNWMYATKQGGKYRMESWDSIANIKYATDPGIAGASSPQLYSLRTTRANGKTGKITKYKGKKVVGLMLGEYSNGWEMYSPSKAIAKYLWNLDHKAAEKAKQAKVGKVTPIKPVAYHAKHGNIYTSKQLKQVRSKAKKYQHTTLYVTKHVLLKQNGKIKAFYYIDTPTVKGWIWKGYLTAGKAIPSLATRNADMSQQFVTQANKYRAAKGMKPVSIDSVRMTLFQQYKTWFKKGKSGYDINDAAFNSAAQKVGISKGNYSSDVVTVPGQYDLQNSKRMNKYAVNHLIIDESTGKPDYKNETILRSKVTKIGINFVTVHGKSYLILLANA